MKSHLWSYCANKERLIFSSLHFLGFCSSMNDGKNLTDENLLDGKRFGPF
jgi:hypothetical protein